MTDRRTEEQTFHRPQGRRGNAMILVAGILVLLVILATAFLTRTQGGRATASAVQHTSTRDNNAKVIADSIAAEISLLALFPWPVDWNGEPNRVVSSNKPRLAPRLDAVRYGVDRDAKTFIPGAAWTPFSDGQPDFPYNFAPYHVVPWTNWPDFQPGLTGAISLWPQDDAGAPSGFTPPGFPFGVPLAESNPFGNPGFGDTRWLRDIEPLRWDGVDGVPGGRAEAFRYWRHLTNISRANNGWRICRDISDVFNRLGGPDRRRALVDDLDIPVEQWLVSVGPVPELFVPLSGTPVTGDAVYPPDTRPMNGRDFYRRWQQWFNTKNRSTTGDYSNYESCYLGSIDASAHDPGFPPIGPARLGIPPNFYNLKDLDGDGITLEPNFGLQGGQYGPGERPQDEFDPEKKAARWDVSRILADSDGDGFTDSFWFLAPTPVERGIRQVVAVSIVDNSALFNANVATSFWPGDTLNPFDPAGFDVVGPDGTLGETPADLAAVGQQIRSNSRVPHIDEPNWNVGFFDTFLNDERSFIVPPRYRNQDGLRLYDEDESTDSPDFQVSWLGFHPALTDRWSDFLVELGVIPADPTQPNLPPSPFRTAGINEANFGFASAYDRREYWRRSGSRPFDPIDALTPFTLADELELRMYHGQNYPWILSRLERAMNTSTTSEDPPSYFLRSGFTFEESTPYLDQLDNTELLYDNRRKMTVVSAARNEQLPPWLQWRWRDNPATPRDDSLPFLIDGLPQPAIDNFLAQSRLKIDLRDEIIPLDVLPGSRFTPGELYLHERLPYVLLNVFADGNERGYAGTMDEEKAHGYFGPYDGYINTGGDPNLLDDLRRLATGFAANILAYSDVDTDAPLVDDPGTSIDEIGALKLTEWGTYPEELTATGFPPGDRVRFLGMERQPFLLESFVGHVYELFTVPPLVGGAGYLNSGKKIILATDGAGAAGSSLESTVAVVQLANPYDKPIVLYDPSSGPADPYYAIDFFGQTISLRDVALKTGVYELPPVRDAAVDSAPATMILYAIDPSGISGSYAFAAQLRNFLDIDPADHSLRTTLVDVNAVLGPGTWSTDRATYDSPAAVPPAAAPAALELVRVYPLGNPGTPPTPARVVVDRIDIPVTGENDGGEYLETTTSLGSDGGTDITPPPHPDPDPIPNNPPNMYYTGGATSEWQPPDSVQTFTHWIQWVRVTRAWGLDNNANSLEDADEINPRYIYADRRLTSSADSADAVTDVRGTGFTDRYYTEPGSFNGVLFNLAANPDAEIADMGQPWFTHDYLPFLGDPTVDLLNRKPTFFDMNGAFAAGGGGGGGGGTGQTPDKGYYHSNYSLQMLQKDDSFQQVGELANVWLHGHELAYNPPPLLDYENTAKTFSEYTRGTFTAERDSYVNRINPGELIGDGLEDILARADAPNDPRHAVPTLPAGIRLLDAFVCDGKARPQQDYDRDGVLEFPGDDQTIWNDRGKFSNALGFVGHSTPGLVNINTAPIEVLRALPHWTTLVHFDPLLVPPIAFPPVRVPQAVVSYRERFKNFGTSEPTVPGFWEGPGYEAREVDTPVAGTVPIRGDRGIAALGELRLVDEPGDPSPNPQFPPSWQIDYAGEAPFAAAADGAYISTDIVGDNYDAADGDGVARDSEERSMLLSGASNLITTRSDVFTVYFRVRSFRQNPDTLVWDATDLEQIVDDARYVMLVDRSGVNDPSDRPRILYLEKLPN